MQGATPTDPYGRNARRRFLRQRCCYPSTVPWCAVIRVRELYVSPLSPTSGCSARRRLPPVGPLGLGVPPSAGLYAATTATVPCAGRFAGRSRPETLPVSARSWCPSGARGLVEAPRLRQGLGSPGPPLREYDKEPRGSPTFPNYPYVCMPRSETPVVSAILALTHSGLLPSGHWKPSAFPSVPLKDILLSTTLRISGLHHAACLLVLSSSARPLLGVHVDVTADLLARLWSGGT